MPPPSRRNLGLYALTLCALALIPMQAQANALDNLEAFLRSVKSGRTEFNQVVTLPARQDQAARQRRSSGTFEFLRPGKFRFVYRKPFEQIIVADGTTLWLYDVDLNQVTARSQSQALGSTPAALVAAAPGLKALQEHFQLSNASERDGLQWVLAVPTSREGQIQQVLIGLRGTELAVLEITDSFGQRSVLSFTRFEANPALATDTFAFKPPPQADVVRQ